MSLNQVEAYPAQAPRMSRPVLGHSGAHWLTVMAWLIVLSTVCVALGPLLVVYGRQLWSAEHYQFVPILLLAVAWLAWMRWKALPVNRSLPGSIILRIGGWGIAMLLTGVAVFAVSPLLSVIAVLALLMAGLYEWRGAAGVWHFLPVLGVLLLAVRPPFGWDQRVILSMQKIATHWGSGVLDLLGMRHMASGVVIRMPEQEFFVAEACSGVHSLFAALAFIAVYSAITHRGFIRVLCLLAAAVFWVLVANILRILAVVVLSTRYHLPVIDGVGHELLGVAVFAIVILMVLSTDRLLLYIAPLREALPSLVTADTGRETAARKPHVSLNRSRRAVWAGAVAVCFVAMAAGLQMMPQARAAAIGPLFAPTEGLVEVPKEALPGRWNGWERTNFEVRENDFELQGEFSRIWNFRKGRMQVAISIDGPFPGWHDTEACYEGLGYVTQSREDHIIPSRNDEAGGYTELSIAGERGRQGYVLFMAYADDGRPLRPPATRYASFARLISVWRSRLAGEFHDELTNGRVYQVQILAEGGVAFSETEKDDLKALFDEMRGRIAEYVSRSDAPANASVAATN